jgi:hypothetical protein
MTESDNDKKERDLRHIGEIPKESNKITTAEFSNLTREQQQAVDEQDKRFGFVKVNQIEKEKLKPEPEVQKMASKEEWRILTNKKYYSLKKITEDNLPQLWLAIEFILLLNQL